MRRQNWKRGSRNKVRILFISPHTTTTEKGEEGTKQEGNGPKDERATMIMASEVSSDLRIELSDLNYHVI